MSEGVGGGGGDGARMGADVDAMDDVDADDPAAWPGLEALPESPPAEYPTRRPWRPRARAEIAVPARPQPRPDVVDEIAPRRRPRSHARLIASLALVAVLLLASLIVLLRRDATEASSAAGRPTTTTTVPGSSTTAPPSTTTPTSTTTTDPAAPTTKPPPDPLLAATIAEVSQFVVGQRGFELGEPIEAIRLPTDQFEDSVRAAIMPQEAEIAAEGNMLKLWGLIDPDVDYVKRYLDNYPKLVGAYFDPGQKRVVVRGEVGTPVSPELKVVLAHELTHAFDFRAFDLYDRTYPDPHTEQQLGFRALLEGDAQRVEKLWAAAHGEAVGDVRAAGQSDVIASRFAATYELGERLVDDIVARGGEPAVNAAFGDPPSTSEQVIHPEKYATKEAPLPMEDPAADGEPLWTGVTGELATSQVLRSALGPDLADRAAAGWGNDKSVVWVQSPSEGGLTCLRIAYVMDTPEDLAELEDGFARWVRQKPRRTGRREGDTVIVTMCEKVPPPPRPFEGPGQTA